MQKRLISILKYAFFLGLGIFLVWWSLHKMSDENYQKFITALKTANYYLLIPVFFILSASHISRAIRWKILMKSMGYNPKLSNTFCAVMVGYLANFAFPRLGEVLKCTILAKYEKVPTDKLVGTILVERAVDVLSFFIVIIISLLTQAHIVGTYAKDFINEYFLSQDTSTAILKVSIILVSLVAIFFITRFIFTKYLHIKFVQQLKNIYHGVIDGLLSVKRLKNKWAFIFHSVFIWSCYLAGTYVGFFAIEQTSHLPVLSTFPVLVFGTVATMITPGGIGSYPELLMKAMLLYNVEEAFGSANGWLQWSAQFIIILVVGFICLAVLPYLNKTKNEISTVNTQ
ncbi:lysylphosphatidylglycerol synthase transmembrane domain-containing protein [Ferruginibacter sp. SUN106]|uniref:lysylphosphatidylglycerol synthase transmembrane domain-containing protein n=1 Tax=Ferruginibacter sp. SUN106 TaxID=2978348 RepID=UPI003D361281